jgi:hypothetical protein
MKLIWLTIFDVHVRVNSSTIGAEEARLHAACSNRYGLPPRSSGLANCAASHETNWQPFSRAGFVHRQSWPSTTCTFQDDLQKTKRTQEPSTDRRPRDGRQHRMKQAVSAWSAFYLLSPRSLSIRPTAWESVVRSGTNNRPKVGIFCNIVNSSVPRLSGSRIIIKFVLKNNIIIKFRNVIV